MFANVGFCERIVSNSKSTFQVNISAQQVCFLLFRYYHFLPYNEDKPCIWVKGEFEDNRKRLFNTNMITKIADKLVIKFVGMHSNLYFYCIFKTNVNMYVSPPSVSISGVFSGENSLWLTKLCWIFLNFEGQSQNLRVIWNYQQCFIYTVVLVFL